MVLSVNPIPLERTGAKVGDTLPLSVPRVGSLNRTLNFLICLHVEGITTMHSSDNGQDVRPQDPDLSMARSPKCLEVSPVYLRPSVGTLGCD